MNRRSAKNDNHDRRQKRQEWDDSSSNDKLTRQCDRFNTTSAVTSSPKHNHHHRVSFVSVDDSVIDDRRYNIHDRYDDERDSLRVKERAYKENVDAEAAEFIKTEHQIWWNKTYSSIND